MTALMTTLIIIHVIISVALIVVVLLQQSKQQNISGAIMGGSSDTFFGKNKGRTVDAMLRKFTSVLAALFIISSVSLAIISVQHYKNEQAATQNAETTPIDVSTDGQDAAENNTDTDAAENGADAAENNTDAPTDNGNAEGEASTPAE